MAGTAMTNEANLTATRETNANNLAIANAANAMAQQNAREQMAFQERMSNSAWQRGVADMKAAGLNPLAAYAQGGASSPVGAQGSVQTATMQSPHFEDVINKGVSSALEYTQLRRQLQETTSNIEVNKAIEGVKKTEKKINEATAKTAENEAKVSEARLPVELKQAEYDRKAAAMDATINRINKIIGGGQDAASAYRLLKKGMSKRP